MNQICKEEAHMVGSPLFPNKLFKIMVLEIVIFAILAITFFVLVVSKETRNEIMASFKTRQARLILGGVFISVILLVVTVWILVQYSNM